MQQAVRKFAQRVVGGAILVGLVAGLTACGSIGSGGSGLFSGRNRAATVASDDQRAANLNQRANLEKSTSATSRVEAGKRKSTLWDLFGAAKDPNSTVAVNTYLWKASLQVLDFLPIESVDPFSGVIVTGYGTPPGGGHAYRATIYVTDPALDARSLKVALVARGGGPVDAATQRAVEDAILTRARQLRVQDSKL